MGLGITGKLDDITDVVIFTQSTLNVRMIADNLLENAYCFNEIRNMQGYAGSYGGRSVAVQGTGIGPVSAAMYATEVGMDFEPKCYFKLEGCKALDERLAPGDLVLAQTAHTTSRINRLRFGGRTFPAAGNFEMMNKAFELAKQQGKNVWAGPVLSLEYRHEMEVTEQFAKRGTLALDMEMNQVYTSAARFGLPALGILCVFENLATGQALSDKEQQEQFEALARFALQVAAG